MQQSIEQISAQFQLGALVQLAIQITNKPMALKSLFLISLLLVGFAVAPTIAQLGGLGNLLGGLINIQGVLFCTANGNANDTSTPVFPNAVVELQCGNTVVSSTTTNGAGTFTFLLDPPTTLLPSLLNNCMLVVKTPLSACNAALPAGILQSTLQFLGKTLLGILGVLNLGPTGFHSSLLVLWLYLSNSCCYSKIMRLWLCFRYCCLYKTVCHSLSSSSMSLGSAISTNKRL